jgi:hypothetical protein
MVSSHKTFGEFGVRHPHWHICQGWSNRAEAGMPKGAAIVLEGGFDRHDRFLLHPTRGQLGRPSAA